MTLLIDSHEPIDLQLLLEQSVELARERLNDFGLADLAWQDAESKWHTYERKQITELLGSLDSVEEQLGRQLRASKAAHYGLLIQGIALPHAEGIACYQWSKTGVAYLSRVVRQSYAGWRAWLNQLEEMGVAVWELPSLEALAAHIVALYNNSLKADHTTLRQHVKPRPFLLQPQQHVLTLMGVEQAGIGEELAQALVGREVDVETGEITWSGKFTTPWEVFNAEPKDIASAPLRSGKRTVGPAAASRLLEAIGRNGK